MDSAYGRHLSGSRNLRERRLLATWLSPVTVALVLTMLVPAPVRGQSFQSPPRRTLVRTLNLTPFYDTPQPLPAGKAGDLIRSESFDDYDLPLSVSVVRILYHSRSATGQDVASSGVILFPAEKNPPTGGWPIIAWAHGLTGVARACAPSLRRNLGRGSLLSMYVNLGYAVVASDYTGLGTNFRNAFLDAESNAMDIIASIPAARAAVPRLSPRWLVIGIAEGGLTALAVSEKEQDLRNPFYMGALVLSDLKQPNSLLDDPQGASSIYLASLVYGTKTLYPQFQVRDVFTEHGLALYQTIQQRCSDLGTVPEIPMADEMKPGWSRNKFVRDFSERSIPWKTNAYRPILLITSAVEHAGQDASEAVGRMCKLGDQVQWEQYPEPDAARLLGDSVRDQIAFIEGRLAGRSFSSTCH